MRPSLRAATVGGDARRAAGDGRARGDGAGLGARADRVARLTLERYWALFVAVAAVAMRSPRRGRGATRARRRLDVGARHVQSRAGPRAGRGARTGADAGDVAIPTERGQPAGRARATTDGERQFDALRVLCVRLRPLRPARARRARGLCGSRRPVARSARICWRGARRRSARRGRPIRRRHGRDDRDAWLANLPRPPGCEAVAAGTASICCDAKCRHRRPRWHRVPPFALWFRPVAGTRRELLLLAVRGRFEVYARQGIALAARRARCSAGTRGRSAGQRTGGRRFRHAGGVVAGPADRRQRLRLEADAEGGAISVLPAPPPRGPERLPAPWNETAWRFLLVAAARQVVTGVPPACRRLRVSSAASASGCWRTPRGSKGSACSSTARRRLEHVRVQLLAVREHLRLEAVEGVERVVGRVIDDGRGLPHQHPRAARA